MQNPVSLYLHIPFCRHRCGYCDFNTYAGLERLTTEYVKALAAEVIYIAQATPEPIVLHSVYFGGGTPSLLSLAELDTIFSAIHTVFEVLPEAEITLEANPGTVTLDYFKGLKSLGVNRISMGVQSANPRDLRILERQHGYEDAIQAVKYIRQAGIDNFSVDLIFGVPGQSLADWQHNVELALGFHPKHISLYSLTVEHDTPLEKMVERGLLAVPHPDLAADMYEWTIERLADDFEHYEISNWTRRDAEVDFRSRHNLQYWRNLPYLGVGAGAHGFFSGHRTMNALAPQAYIDRLSKDPRAALEFPRTPATIQSPQIDAETEMAETMMMGLRLINEGVSVSEFEARFGVPLTEVYQAEIERLSALELIQWQQNRLCLTKRGTLVGNQVFVEFV